MIRAIFFDFDGVLVDSEPLHLACWAEVLAGYGMPLSAEFYYANFVGVSNQEMIQRLCRQFGKGYDAEFFGRCYTAKKILYQDRARGHCRMPQELVTFIQTGPENYRFGVVSSSSRCEVEPHLVGHGVREAITALVCQEDVAELKPAPDPYLRALELVNAGADERIGAGECLVIEDSGPGAEAGRRAGMQVLRVPGPGEVLGLLRAELGG